MEYRTWVKVIGPENKLSIAAVWSMGLIGEIVGVQDSSSDPPRSPCSHQRACGRNDL